MITDGYTMECIDNMGVFLDKFIDRFGCWKQLQLSAMLSRRDDFWYQTKVGDMLRKFVFSYDYSKALVKTNPDDQVFLKKIKDRILDIQGWTNGRKTVGTAKYMQYYGLFNGGFFYLRESELEPLQYTIPKGVPCDYDCVIINDWLAEHGALCVVEDNPKMSQDSKKEMEKQKTIAEDSDTLFSGWLRC